MEEKPGQPYRGSDVLTIEQAAEYLQMSVPIVRQLAARSELPGRRFSRGVGWRFARMQLLEHIEAGNQAALGREEPASP